MSAFDNRRKLVLTLGLISLLAIAVCLRQCSRSDSEREYLKQKAEQLHRDPDRILAFVRDQVQTAPYQGVLRGAVGTLFDGSGSPADRTLLLAGLLKAAGRSTRLARAGERWWVQMAQADRWQDLFVDPADASPAEWTGAAPPAGTEHRLTCTLEIEGGSASHQTAVELPVSEALLHPLLIRVEAHRVRLLSLGTKRRADCPRTGAEDERCLLRFRLRAPGRADRLLTRELFSRRHADYRALDSPTTMHLVLVAPARLPAHFVEQEQRFAAASHGFFPMQDAQAAYQLGLSFLASSDAALSLLEEEFEASAFLVEPRLIVVSRYAGESASRPPYWALDLRHDRVRVEASEQHRTAFQATRSELEGLLEQRVLAGATGGSALGALDLFSRYLDASPPAATSTRVAAYADALSRLIEEGRRGAQLLIANGDQGVQFERDARAELRVVRMDPPLPDLLDTIKPALRVLTHSDTTLGAEQIPIAAVELEVLLGPAQGGATDYTPRMEYQASTEDLLFTDARIFKFRERGEGEQASTRLTFEFQFKSTEGDLVYQCIDHWDEIGEREITRSFEFRVPETSLDTGRIYSMWYDQSIFDAGCMNMMLGRQSLDQVKRTGQTTMIYRRSDGSLTDPLTLFVCRRGEIDVWINNRPAKLPAFWLAGGYGTEPPDPLDYDQIPLLFDETDPRGTGNPKLAINRYVVLDNPEFPLIGIQNSRFQSSLPGRITSTGTGAGIGGAQITVKGPGVRATTWADGHFELPVFSEAFGTFQVRVLAAGYKPYEEQIDFTRADSLPLTLTLDPAPDPEGFLWLTAGDERLQELENQRVREFVARDLAEHPDWVALVPRARRATGAGSALAWLYLDREDGSFVAATEDGLFAASALGGFASDWATNMGLQQVAGMGTPYEAQTGAINYFSGYIASWYAYSAGRLDALSGLIEGQPMERFGHDHALRVARAFLSGMDPLLDSTAMSLLGGVRGTQYRAGFAAGLQFFESHPEYWSAPAD